MILYQPYVTEMITLRIELGVSLVPYLLRFQVP